MFKKGVLLLFVLALGACNSVPNKIVISPELNGFSASNNLMSAPVKVDMSSLTSPLVSVYKDSALVSSITMPNDLQSILARKFNNHTSQTITKRIALTIDDLAVKVHRKTLSHDTSLAVSITVHSNVGSSKFVKQFSANKQYEAPLRHDVAVIERQLSRLLDVILNEIDVDTELSTFLETM